MARTVLDYNNATIQTVRQKSVKCRQCGTLLKVGQEYYLVGTSVKLCKECYEDRKTKADMKKDKAKQKTKKREKLTDKNNIYFERKCPACGETKDMHVVDYDIAKENKDKGAFVFTYECRCGTQFICQMDI
jgi:ribosome-binding protein aMBF1 (putative translation factor)